MTVWDLAHEAPLKDFVRGDTITHRGARVLITGRRMARRMALEWCEDQGHEVISR